MDTSIKAAGRVEPACPPIAPNPYVKPMLKTHIPIIDNARPYVVTRLFGSFERNITKRTNIKKITKGKIALTPPIISTYGV